MRFPVAALMRPKEAELMSVTGLPHCGLFMRLITSARKLNLVLSVIVKFLLTAPLKLRAGSGP